jgi:hypothetical protein
VKLYLHSPNTLSRRVAQFKHRDNFTIITFTRQTERLSRQSFVEVFLSSITRMSVWYVIIGYELSFPGIFKFTERNPPLS